MQNFASVHHEDSFIQKRNLDVFFMVVGVLILVACLGMITHQKWFSGTSPTQGLSVAEAERQLQCMAINVYHEARGESFEGMVAVAQVTKNRAQSPLFTNDVCGVVYQKDRFSGKQVCQFSWYCEKYVKVVDPEAFKESMVVAKKVLIEGFELDILKDALYYHADYVNPRWKKQRVAKIGRHIFYKERI